MPNSLTPSKPDKKSPFEQLKDWMKFWQVYPAIAIVFSAGVWATNVQAAQGHIRKEQTELKEDARAIKDDLRYQRQKDDERWERMMNKLGEIQEMLGGQGREN